ncbi:MAG: Ig-like domain-containing protein, partial [Rudaea sp.]|nr:Ig-like domain-containing protein [Rudaea sp.]
ANGTITPPTQTVNFGTTASFTVTPNASYHVASVTGDTCTVTQQGTTTTWVSSAITANCVVTATFAINTYTVTATASANGTITPPTQTVNSGSTASFTVTPNAGYHVVSVSGDTCTVTQQGTTTTWVSSAITANCAVTATFAINTYTVTATAGANGTITPPTQTVNYGAAASFTVTPVAGYHAAVTGDTCTVTQQGTTTTWISSAITADCTVTASFSISTYVVTADSGANGTLTLADSGVDLAAVPYGSVLHFTVTPDAGYSASVAGCGGTLVGNTYTTDLITADCTVTATFDPLPVATAQFVTVVYGKATLITLSAAPPVGGTFVFAIVTNPVNGSITNFDPNSGTLTYTPNVGFSGPDSFTFTATNSVGTSQPAMVSIAVQAAVPVPNVPVPALDWRALWLLMLAIIAVAMRVQRAGKRD